MDRWKDKLKLRAPAVLLLMISLLFWGFYDPYEQIGPALLEAPTLADALRVRGDVAEANGEFVLRVPEGGKTADLRFKLDGAVEFSTIRLIGSIRTDQVVEGKYSWNSARLLLIQRDAEGKWIPGKHSLLSKDGTVPWTAQVRQFDLDPNAASAEVVISQTGKSGTAWFKEVVALPVQLKASFFWFRILFASVWLVTGLFFFRRCRLDRRKLRILILLNAMAILYGTLMPGDWIETISEQVKEKGSEMIRKSEDPKVGAQDQSIAKKKASPVSGTETKKIGQFGTVVGTAHKLGHFGLFASLCFLVYCSAWLEKQHPVYYFKVAFDILLFAAISESLQYLTSDRTPGLLDWRTDVYGMCLAFILFLMFQLIIKVWKECKRRLGV
ncbi:VanZ family protein [Pontiellaceae bacterium B12227]|nr:VanZ family protein [Pontiellaceae bacterium B12227]